MPKRKAEVKKAAPFVAKLVAHWGIAVILTWWFAKYVVIEYGGVWPDISIIHVVLDFYKIIGAAGAVLIMQALFEIYRKRKD